MFEREIKFIYDFNLNKVNRLGPYFTFEQLASIDLHPAISNYISAEIDFLVFEDRQTLLKNSVFDYSGEKISNHFIAIGEEVKKTKRFSLEYISKLILHASSFTINYLIRPKWTLAKFVYDEGDHKTTLEIKQILNYIYYYQYLKKILISYINSKKIISMNSDEFKELLDKVDKIGIETSLTSILSNAAKSMSDFFNIGEIQKNKIPFIAIEKFLEEKELNNHLDKLHNAFGTDNAQKITISDLQKTFDGVMIERFETVTTEEPLQGEEEIKEEFQPVSMAEPVSEEETIRQETVPESDTLPDYTSGEEVEEKDEINKPAKLRIRIDKDLQIEPVEESDEVLNEPDTPEEIEEDYSALEEIVNINRQPDSEAKEEEQDELPEADLIQENLVEEESSEIEEEIENAEQLNLIEDEEESDQLETNIDDHENQPEQPEPESPTEDENESMLESILEASESDSVNDEDNSGSEETDNGEKQRMDIAELLEHKEMTKIIEVIFDYDIEEFANLLDEISGCQSLDDAYVVLNQSLKNRNINRNSREAEAFKSIISQYFNDK